MKKLFCFLLPFILSFALCSCANETDTIRVPVNFYYPLTNAVYGTQSGVIDAEIFDAENLEDDYPNLLRCYLEGPHSETLRNFFPIGTELISFYDFNGHVQIIFTSHLSKLSNAELTVACACITKTVIELTGAETVQINTEDSSLNEIESVRFTLENFVCFNAD